jgi:hypothetical protein
MWMEMDTINYYMTNSAWNNLVWIIIFKHKAISNSVSKTACQTHFGYAVAL